MEVAIGTVILVLVVDLLQNIFLEFAVKSSVFLVPVFS